MLYVPQVLRLGGAYTRFMGSMVCPGWPGLYKLLLRNKWRGTSARQNRLDVWAWQAGWAKHLDDMTNRALHVTVRFALSDEAQAADVTGTAWLWRTNTPTARAANRRRISAMAQRVRADGVSVMLFPEGHRWKPKYLTGGFRKVLPPYVGGFDAITNEVPDYPILHLTLQRTPRPDGGIDLVVHGRMRQLPRGLSRQEKKEILTGWWRESDVLLAA